MSFFYVLLIMYFCRFYLLYIFRTLGNLFFSVSRGSISYFGLSLISVIKLKVNEYDENTHFK